MGERTPHLDPHARAALVGLSASHTRAHVVRAILEGVAFSLQDTFEIFAEMQVPVTRVRLGGGGARSPVWRQIQADVYGHDAEIVEAEEGAAYGAALLAGVGARSGRAWTRPATRSSGWRNGWRSSRTRAAACGSATMCSAACIPHYGRWKLRSADRASEASTAADAANDPIVVQEYQRMKAVSPFTGRYDRSRWPSPRRGHRLSSPMSTQTHPPPRPPPPPRSTTSRPTRSTANPPTSAPTRAR